ESPMCRFSARSIALIVAIVAAFAAVPTPVLGNDDDAARQPILLLSLDFARDGSSLVTGGDSVRVYGMESGELLMQAHPPKITRTVAFSPTEKDLFAAAGDDGAIRLWHVDNAEPTRVLKGHSGMVLDLAFSPDNKLLASGGTQYVGGRRALGELRLWDTESGKLLHSLDFADAGVQGVSFSRDGGRLAFCKNSAIDDVPSTVNVYNVENWELVHSVPFSPGFAQTVLFTTDGSRLIVTGGYCVPLSPTSCRPTGKIWFAELSTSEPAKLLETSASDYFRSASLTSEGEFFATGTARHHYQLDTLGKIVGQSLVAEIQLRKTDTGKIVWSQEGEIGDPYGVTISRDGEHVACCSGSKVLIFDASSGRQERAITVGE
ncbi:MAG: WD40 repeat domain-containing protein, partial [Aeoliella sp.]